MFITWLLTGIVAGFFVGVFFEEIIEWAKEIFENISSSVRKAWVYIRRVPTGLKRMIRYIHNGGVEQKTEIVDWETVCKMHERGDIDDETYRELEAYNEQKIAELNRDR